MPETWPSTLPQDVQVSGYTAGSPDGRIAHKPEYGPSIVRRRTSASVRPLTAEIICTSAQLDDLRTFVDTTLIGGTLPFNFPSPESDAETLLVRFDSSAQDALPTWQNVHGDYWRVKMKLEVLP